MSEEVKDQEENTVDASNEAAQDTDNKEVESKEPTAEEKYNELNDK